MILHYVVTHLPSGRKIKVTVEGDIRKGVDDNTALYAVVDAIACIEGVAYEYTTTLNIDT